QRRQSSRRIARRGRCAPTIKARLAELGSTAIIGPPEQFGAFVKAETEKWERVIRLSGTKVIEAAIWAAVSLTRGLYEAIKAPPRAASAHSSSTAPGTD